VKYKFSKVAIITLNVQKLSNNNFYFEVKLCLVLHTPSVFVNITRYCRTGWCKKIKLQTRSYLLQILKDFILQIYISHSSVATQLRCGGIFYNKIANVPQNVPVKKIENRSIFGKGMDKSFQLTFWATLYFRY